MNLFDGAISITGITYLVFFSFQIILFGFLLGRINIKGINLGAAGVFIVALLFGVAYSSELGQTVTQVVAGEKVDISSNTLKVIETSGLVLFVASVALIAGPGFFSNLKKNFKKYVLIGLIITIAGIITALICFAVGRGDGSHDQELIAALAGVLSGALTNASALASAQSAVATIAAGPGSALSVQDAEAIVVVGYGISYVFGVIGVVLFVQLIPQITKANMDEERKKFKIEKSGKKIEKRKWFEIDPKGLFVLAFVIVMGLLVGALRVPLSPQGYSGATFSLTSTGGVLLLGLIVGHFGHIGPIGVNLAKETLTSVRELGLVLFLIGSGVSGGMKLVEFFKIDYFIYGFFITLIPMIVAYLFSKHVLKIQLLDNLASITGGMTSTPALASLIYSSKTDKVASAYAATYPIALIALVISSQFFVLILS